MSSAKLRIVAPADDGDRAGSDDGWLLPPRCTPSMPTAPPPCGKSCRRRAPADALSRRPREEQRLGVGIHSAPAFRLARHGHRHGAYPPPGHFLNSSSRSSLILDPNTGLPSSENVGIDGQYNLVENAISKSVMTGTTFSEGHLRHSWPAASDARNRAFFARYRGGSRGPEIAERISRPGWRRSSLRRKLNRAHCRARHERKLPIQTLHRESRFAAQGNIDRFSHAPAGSGRPITPRSTVPTPAWCASAPMR